MIRVRYQFPVTSPGAMLREERKAGTALGIEAEKSTSQGQLAPDSIVNALVETWLSRHEDSFVFDGYPRSLRQATALDQLLAPRRTPIEVVLSLEADLHTIHHRVERRLMCVSCGGIVSIGLHVFGADAPCPVCGNELSKRNDDTVGTVALRMREYEDKTEPVIEYFRERRLLSRVDGTRTPEMVFAAITEILEGA